LPDRLEVTFGKMAFEGDTAAGMLLVKCAERKSTLSGLNSPIGHAVRVVSHPPANEPTNHDKIEAALDCLLAEQRAGDGGEPHY
jgi:hypothetical protein